MGPDSSADTILNVLAFLSGIILAILAAAQASLTVVLAVCVVFVVLMIAAFWRRFWESYRLWSEERERAKSREAKGLHLIDETQIEKHPQELPDGVYGYEELYALHGLLGTEAKLHSERWKPNGLPYPLEVRRYAGDTYLVGYVDVADRQKLEGAADAEIHLRMRRDRQHKVLVDVPLSQITTGENHGDRPIHQRLDLRLNSLPATLTN